MVYSNNSTYSIIIALNNTYQRFRYLFIGMTGYRLNNRENNEAITEVYKRLSENICKNLLEPLKNKYLTVQSFDNSHQYQYMIDALIFDTSSLTGFLLSYEQAHEIVNRVEISAIEDICEFLPDIDDSKVTVNGFVSLPHNSIMINISLHYETTCHNQFR